MILYNIAKDGMEREIYPLRQGLWGKGIKRTRRTAECAEGQLSAEIWRA